MKAINAIKLIGVLVLSLVTGLISGVSAGVLNGYAQFNGGGPGWWTIPYLIFIIAVSFSTCFYYSINRSPYRVWNTVIYLVSCGLVGIAVWININRQFGVGFVHQ